MHRVHYNRFATFIRPIFADKNPVFIGLTPSAPQDTPAARHDVQVDRDLIIPRVEEHQTVVDLDDYLLVGVSRRPERMYTLAKQTWSYRDHG